MRRKGRERVFTIFLALVLVIILVSSIIAVNGTFQMYDFTVNINGNYISFAYILKDLGGIHVC